MTSFEWMMVSVSIVQWQVQRSTSFSRLEREKPDRRAPSQHSHQNEDVPIPHPIFRWRLRRQHLTLSYTPSIKLNFLSLSQPKVDESNDFLPWLGRKAGAEILSALSIGKSAHGTSLFASKSITAGDCILKVPYSVALKNFPEISKSITYKDFMHAYALATSRAWGSMKGYSLIPFADFLNHDGTSESIVLTDDDKHFSEVIADRNYAPGEQVLIRYGKFSNATLLLDFGFTLSYNIHDQVQIQGNIPHHDVLREMKWELLKRHHQSVMMSPVSTLQWILSLSRKLGLVVEKGKEFQSLHAFARVLCCTSPQELSDLAKEAAEHDGRLARRPLKNSSREIKALQMLSGLTQLAEAIDASIKSLGPVSSPIACERLSIRRQMGRDLLNGELRVLKSASAWLRSYCDTLTTTDCHR